MKAIACLLAMATLTLNARAKSTESRVTDSLARPVSGKPGDSIHRLERSENMGKTVFFGVEPGFDIGFASFQDHGNATLSPGNKALALVRGKTSNVTLDVLKLRIKLDPDHFRLISGLGIDWTNYRFANDINLPRSQDLQVIEPSAVHYTKNKLTSSYLRMPLLLKVNFGRRRSTGGFYLAAGGEAGYLIGSHTKQTSHENGKVKIQNDFNLNPWKTAVVARIGYGDFNIFGKYYLSKVFDQQSFAPGLNSFAIGISFGGF